MYNTHPITGRQDAIRADADWRRVIEHFEGLTGHVICGRKLQATGDPCLNKPVEGKHRCHIHSTRPVKHYSTKTKYHPKVKYGMNLNTFLVCSRCKVEHCGARVTDGTNDDCPIEIGIYKEVMELKDKYDLSDTLQEGMLESVAFIFIKRYRCERFIADEGMILEDIVGFSESTGKPYTNKKEHPLLKTASSLNKELIAFADSIEFSPKAVNRKKDDKDVGEGINLIKNILQDAHNRRSE
jgi:hypothetical protein